jgi:hypothetical protein
MGVIFLSYRRGDSAATCERIYDRLRSRFGKDSVFMDVDAIPIGVRFPQYLTSVVQQADIVLAIIGPQWLEIRAEDGTRRLGDPQDFVRLEVEVALGHRIPIVPVVVEGAAMPAAAQLPESLRGLTDHNAIAIRGNPDFDGDVNRLAHAIVPLRARPHRSFLDRVAALGIYAAFALACAALIAVALVLLGAQLPIGSSPLLDLIHRYPLPTLVVTGLLTLATLSSVVLLRANARAGAPVPEELAASTRTGWRGPRQAIALATSSVSALTLFALLAVTLARPPWCPTALCPPPQILTRGVHDANLEVYLTAIESALFEIPGDPQHYTLANLPREISAQRIDRPNQSPYRVVVGIHSLQQGRFGLIIEQVAAVIDTTPVTPNPLNIWNAGPGVEYTSTPFQATYRGEPAGASLIAHDVPYPEAQIQLRPGESDEIDLEMLSTMLADIQFHVEVTYKVTNESARHTVALPQRFEAVFSNTSNWHLYTLQDGRLVAQP